MISQKTKYGLKAAVFLAKNAQKDVVLITDIARAEGIPQKFLEAILLELRKKGILKSKKGKGGGYALGRGSHEIMVGDIIRTLDGPLAPVSCVSHSAYARCKECKSEDKCEIKGIMKEVRDAISGILDKTSLLDVLEKTAQARNVANYVI